MGTISQPAQSAPTIMIADCDEEDRCLLKSILELKGFTVLEAANGQEAFDLAMSANPSLMLIDLKLPVVGGFTVIRRIRKLARLRDIPIIAISLSEPASHRRLALAAGCAAHIDKPIEFQELDVLIDRFLPGERWHLASAMVH